MSDTTKNTKVATKEVAKKEVKKEAVKVAYDFKALAESMENAFKADKRVDVVADSKLPRGPQNTTEADWRYVHFYNPGTEKNMFGCYVQTKEYTKFSMPLKVESYLDKSLKIEQVIKTVNGKKKPVYLVVSCPNADVIATAKKILEGFEKYRAATPAKAEKKKAEPKAEKKVEKSTTKQTTAKKTTAKKVVNK